MSFVLCAGPNPALQRTLRFPQLQWGEVNRARQKQVSGGGKGTNVARILGQLGQAARLLTFVGGAVGDEFLSVLAVEGVEVVPVRTVASTRVCFTLIEDEAGRQTEIVEEAEPVREEEVGAYLETYRELLPQARAVVISGTSPPGTPATLYAELVSRAREAGLPVILDAPGELLLRGVQERPLLAKPNRRELSALFPELPLEEQMRKLLEMGAQNVLVTDGPHPAFFLSSDRRLRVVPPEVIAVNPIGSGDAVAAGIAFALLAGKELVEAVRFGIACGVANTQTPLAGHLDPACVERFFPLVSIREDY
ncbi:MAG: hexose kinase [candidate division KSB1 bacterium]|nr:hexose kinase [candidate division KSB1 bacterium]